MDIASSEIMKEISRPDDIQLGKVAKALTRKKTNINLSNVFHLLLTVSL
tara:strand:- start:41 stop:187 length:147 start_codon:yes stop_codon:yes gene_type:complete